MEGRTIESHLDSAACGFAAALCCFFAYAICAVLYHRSGGKAAASLLVGVVSMVLGVASALAMCISIILAAKMSITAGVAKVVGKLA